MVQSADIHYDENTASLRLGGAWTLAHYTQLQAALPAWKHASTQAQRIDMSEVQALDTAGAALLAELFGADRLLTLADHAEGLSESRRALLRTVSRALKEAPEVVTHPPRSAMLEVLEHIGQTMVSIWNYVLSLLGFIGLVLATAGGVLLRPRRWRITSLVAHMEQTGFNAVPIVALLTFMVGAVVAFLGATVLADFGATQYTVDLVAYSFMREFGVLLTAILLAGRTASAFTAQIGSMKANEELDAIRTLGLDPVELLVVPRVLALLIVLPLLTFLAMMSGMLGGALVCMVSLDIPLSLYMSIIQNDVDLNNFIVGMAKAPIFAFLIAVIGCLEGFQVGGSAQSVGEHTTSSVVQSIFVVILVDAVAALFLMEMGW